MKKNGQFWKGFLRLWMVLFLSYFIIKIGYNWAAFGWIDLRQKAFLELLLVPLGQSAVAWFFSAPVSVNAAQKPSDPSMATSAVNGSLGLLWAR